MNVARGLAWLGQPSIAAGVWGAEDFESMRVAVDGMGIDVCMTVVAGRTRQNVTVIDTLHGREMHLRCACELASDGALRKLKGDLGRLVCEGDVCVFAGAMSEAGVEVVESCQRRGGRIVVDTHGAALWEIVERVKPWLISPNVEELGELIGEPVRDGTASLARASERLLDRVGNVLISRGKKGAVLVTPDGVWAGQAVKMSNVVHTVGCGDYLLAGFLARAAWAKAHPTNTLTMALTAATAHACGWTHEMSWAAAKRRTTVEVGRL